MANIPDHQAVLDHIQTYFQNHKDHVIGISATVIYDDHGEPMSVGGCSANTGAIMFALLKHTFDASAINLGVSREELAGALLQEDPAEEPESAEEGRG